MHVSPSGKNKLGKKKLKSRLYQCWLNNLLSPHILNQLHNSTGAAACCALWSWSQLHLTCWFQPTINLLSFKYSNFGDTLQGITRAGDNECEIHLNKQWPTWQMQGYTAHIIQGAVTTSKQNVNHLHVCSNSSGFLYCCNAQTLKH